MRQRQKWIRENVTPGRRQSFVTSIRHSSRRQDQATRLTATATTCPTVTYARFSDAFEYRSPVKGSTRHSELAGFHLWTQKCPGVDLSVQK